MTNDGNTSRFHSIITTLITWGNDDSNHLELNGCRAIRRTNTRTKTLQLETNYSSAAPQIPRFMEKLRQNFDNLNGCLLTFSFLSCANSSLISDVIVNVNVGFPDGAYFDFAGVVLLARNFRFVTSCVLNFQKAIIILYQLHLYCLHRILIRFFDY